MIENPYVGMKVIPSDDLRRSIRRWMSEGWYSPETVDRIASSVDCFDKDGKPYTVIEVTKGAHVRINSAKVRGLMFHPTFFDEYIKPISIDYKRINELI